MSQASPGHPFIDFQRPELLPERIGDFIRNGIIEGKWPPGARLIENQLARRLGVSRAPLREAIRLLAAEGLVTLSPHRGATVSETSPQELADLFAVRGNLEAFAAELAVNNASDEQIARMRRLLEDMARCHDRSDLAGWYAAGLEFHNVLIEAAGNAVLLNLYDQVKAQFRRYQAAMARLPALPTVSLAEHADILDAIERRDPEAARRLAEVHVSHLSQRFLDHELAAGQSSPGLATGGQR
jgi:DNA-binding GntR family transcriptional regulator